MENMFAKGHTNLIIILKIAYANRAGLFQFFPFIRINFLIEHWWHRFFHKVDLSGRLILLFHAEIGGMLDHSNQTKSYYAQGQKTESNGKFDKGWDRIKGLDFCRSIYLRAILTDLVLRGSQLNQNEYFDSSIKRIIFPCQHNSTFVGLALTIFQFESFNFWVAMGQRIGIFGVRCHSINENF